jgi:hypothetical protein
MHVKSTSTRFLALAALAAIGISMGKAANAADSVPVQSPGGDACTVTSGPIQGASGHYANGGGILMCSGSFGSVPCDLKDGIKQCKSASVAGPVRQLPKAGLSKSFVFTR